MKFFIYWFKLKFTNINFNFEQTLILFVYNLSFLLELHYKVYLLPELKKFLKVYNASNRYKRKFFCLKYNLECINKKEDFLS